MTFAVNVNQRMRERKDAWEEYARYRYHDPSPDAWMV